MHAGREKLPGELGQVEGEESRQLGLQWKMRVLSSRREKSSNAERGECFYPSARMHHCSVYYKNKIYLWGGTISENDKSNPLFLYIYELDIKKWKRVWTKTICKDFQAIVGQCHTIISNRWYLLGGANKYDNYCSQLWRLNLDSLEWIKCEQRGEPPKPTEAGVLLTLEKNWLLHYEGFNSRSPQDIHSIYIYSIDNKAWHRCEGNYQRSLKFRLAPALSIHNGRVFMFGGAYPAGERLQYLSDMYELKLHLPSKFSKARVDVRTISKRSPVPVRAGHVLFPLNKDALFLLGGSNDQKAFSDLWVFNLKNEEWWKVKEFHCAALERMGASYAMGGGEVFVFGGLEEVQGRAELKNELWSLQVEWKGGQIEQDLENTEASFNLSCCLCYQKRNNFLLPCTPFSSQTIKDLRQTLEFPFAAFALLLDNALLLSATEITLRFDSDSSGLYLIKVQDNGRNNWQSDELCASLGAFCSQNQMMLMACEKKIKKEILRGNSIKEYGSNLKLACLRLGKRFLLISFAGQILRVWLYYEESSSEEEEDRQYLLRHYAWNEREKQLLDPAMLDHQQYIELEYRKYIREVLASKMSKNVVYVFDTVLDDEEEDLTYRQDINDLYYGNFEDIEDLAKQGFYVNDCIDVSLKAYLSALYLKNQHLTLNFAVRTYSFNINLQNSLEQIDRLSRTGYALELQSIVDFDFKFAEFYYLRDIKPHQRFFSNGILLYYKNRLICRYQPALGEMIPFLLREKCPPSNYLPLFGFAELPENIPHNASKTTFTFTIMLEKMLSRLKFVQQSFKNRRKEFLPMSHLPHPKPKIDDDDDDIIHKRRSFNDNSDERIKKRNSERNIEEPVRKRSKKELQRADFTLPSYKMKQIEMQMEMRKTRQQQAIFHSESNPPVLIEHEDSSIQEIRKK